VLLRGTVSYAARPGGPLLVIITLFASPSPFEFSLLAVGWDRRATIKAGSPAAGSRFRKKTRSLALVHKSQRCARSRSYRFTPPSLRDTARGANIKSKREKIEVSEYGKGKRDADRRVISRKSHEIVEVTGWAAPVKYT
jgi:hypothetical protein